MDYLDEVRTRFAEGDFKTPGDEGFAVGGLSEDARADFTRDLAETWESAAAVVAMFEGLFGAPFDNNTLESVLIDLDIELAHGIDHWQTLLRTLRENGMSIEIDDDDEDDDD